MSPAAPLRLQTAEALLVLDPAHGGAITGFEYRGRPVLRTGVAGPDPFLQASFPLVPYVNRIAQGRFALGGREVRLTPNWSADPHPLHGQGWRAGWDVVESGPAAATLRFEGGGDEWPWRYRVLQRIQLTVKGLSLRLAVTNLAATPMPAALGLHPYFPDAALARLSAEAVAIWLTDAAALPVAQVPVPESWSFGEGRAVTAVPLDNCFAGWNGHALLRWPDFSVSLRATGCRFMHVYVPREGGFFCVEPQTVATGAFNRRDEVPLLPPGQELAIGFSLSVEAQ